MTEKDKFTAKRPLQPAPSQPAPSRPGFDRRQPPVQAAEGRTLAEFMFIAW